MRVCYRHLIGDDPYSVILRVPRVESRLFSGLPHSAFKSRYCGFIDSNNGTFCAWKKRTGIPDTQAKASGGYQSG
jgi:hypothetical protein